MHHHLTYKHKDILWKYNKEERDVKNMEDDIKGGKSQGPTLIRQWREANINIKKQCNLPKIDTETAGEQRINKMIEKGKDKKMGNDSLKTQISN